jgi:hypothetical protein
VDSKIQDLGPIEQIPDQVRNDVSFLKKAVQANAPRVVMETELRR